MSYLENCKCCLESGRLRSMWDEHIRDGKREIYGEMLTSCFALNWEQPDHEERICDLCLGRLRNAIAFKKQVLVTDRQLREQLEDEEDDKKAKHSLGSENTESLPSSDSSDSEYEDVEFLDSECFEEMEKSKLIEIKIKNTRPTENEVGGQNKLSDTKNDTATRKSARLRKHGTDGDNDVNSSSKEKEPVSKKYYELVAKTMKRDLLIGNTTISKLKTESDTEDVEKPTKRKYNSTLSDHSYTQEEMLVDYEEEIDSTDIVAENEEEVETTEIETSVTKKKKPVLRQLYEKNSEREKHQDNLRAILICSNATPIRKRTDGGYMCAFCNFLFEEPAMLKHHTIQVHDNITKAKYKKETGLSTFSVKLDLTSLQCNLCNADINTLEELLLHFKTVHNKKVHTDLKNYMIPLKFDSERLTCFMCGERFQYFKLLTQHMTDHYKNFQCELCDLHFFTNRGLRCHNRRHASGVYNCSHCPKVFDAKIKLAHHERTVHRHGRFTIPCGFCGEKFKDNDRKLRHLAENHGVKIPMHKCDFCEKTFKRKKSLKRHIDSYHLSVKKYKCAECEREFYEKKSYQAHVVMHSKVKAYECEVCQRKFGVKWSLVQHLRIHYEEPRFECERCGHGFHQKNSWRLHMMKIHNESHPAAGQKVVRILGE